VAEYSAYAALLKAMAHPVRLQILDMLRHGETCVCHIEAALDRRQAYVSQQLMILREAGLVESRKEGLQVYYWLAHPQARAVLIQLLGHTDERDWVALDHCRCPTCVSYSVPLAEVR
jgi:ArsR family transcriptional regulator